jgi:hypothetical protein
MQGVWQSPYPRYKFEFSYIIVTIAGSRGFFPMKEEFEDTKGAIRIRISKKNRQNNGQMN